MQYSYRSIANLSGVRLSIATCDDSFRAIAILRKDCLVKKSVFFEFGRGNERHGSPSRGAYIFFATGLHGTLVLLPKSLNGYQIIDSRLRVLFGTDNFAA